MLVGMNKDTTQATEATRALVKQEVAQVEEASRAINVTVLVNLIPYVQLLIIKEQAIQKAKTMEARARAISEFAALAVTTLEIGLDKDVVTNALVEQALESTFEAIRNTRTVIADVVAHRLPPAA
jgi:hypothetical protein